MQKMGQTYSVKRVVVDAVANIWYQVGNEGTFY